MITRSELDYIAEQRLAEVIWDMGFESIEDWYDTEMLAKENGLDSPTEAYEFFIKVTSRLNGIKRRTNNSN